MEYRLAREKIGTIEKNKNLAGSGQTDMTGQIPIRAMCSLLK